MDCYCLLLLLWLSLVFFPSSEGLCCVMALLLVRAPGDSVLHLDLALQSLHILEQSSWFEVRAICLPCPNHSHDQPRAFNNRVACAVTLASHQWWRNSLEYDWRFGRK